MPTSVPGSSVGRTTAGRLRRAAARGFTVIELVIVIAIVAVAAALISTSLPDRRQLQLDEEAERLAALLEAARLESRVSGVTVRWVPRDPNVPRIDGDGSEADFNFVGLSAQLALPTRWLDADTRVQIPGRPLLVLGPEPVLAPQRVLLALGPHRLQVASDGLGPFGVGPVPEGDGGPAR